MTIETAERERVECISLMKISRENQTGRTIQNDLEFYRRMKSIAINTIMRRKSFLENIVVDANDDNIFN